MWFGPGKVQFEEISDRGRHLQSTQHTMRQMSRRKSNGGTCDEFGCRCGCALQSLFTIGYVWLQNGQTNLRKWRQNTNCAWTLDWNGLRCETESSTRYIAEVLLEYVSREHSDTIFVSLCEKYFTLSQNVVNELNIFDTFLGVFFLGCVLEWKMWNCWKSGNYSFVALLNLRGVVHRTDLVNISPRLLSNTFLEL